MTQTRLHTAWPERLVPWNGKEHYSLCLSIASLKNATSYLYCLMWVLWQTYLTGSPQRENTVGCRTHSGQAFAPTSEPDGDTQSYKFSPTSPLNLPIHERRNHPSLVSANHQVGHNSNIFMLHYMPIVVSALHKTTVWMLFGSCWKMWILQFSWPLPSAAGGCSYADPW